MRNIVLFIDSQDALLVTAACVSAFISAAAVIVALYYNHKTQNQYIESLKPQLSMKLNDYEGFIYLIIQNTGRTAAKDIKIAVKNITGNGLNAQLYLDGLFDKSLELYPQETTQGRVALSGASLGTEIFPSVNIDVQYKIEGEKRQVSYSRSVTFSKYYDQKVFADVNTDQKELLGILSTTTRAAVRIANYLDGCETSKIDELDVISGRSLHDDLGSVIVKVNKSNVVPRQEVITACQSNQTISRYRQAHDLKSDEAQEEDFKNE